MPENPVLLTRQGELDRLIAGPCVLSSAALGWPGLALEYRRADAGAMPEVYAPWHTIAFVCDSPPEPTLLCRSGGQQWQEQTQVGDTAIIPAGVSYGVEWVAPIAVLTLMVEPTALATAIEGSQTPAQIELTAQFSGLDPLLYQLGLALQTIVASDGTRQRLYAESLIHTLMLHLQQHYTTRKTQPQVYDDGLSQVRLAYVLDYVHTHLDADLSLTELADLLHLSPHYFAHLFKQSTGITPHQYVIHQRVEQAKRLLRQPDVSIAAIAIQVGFANQAHLTRHFKRLVGVTPGAFRARS